MLSGCDGFFISSRTKTTLASSATTIAQDASITLTATVTTSAATGTVTFYNGSTQLGTGTLTTGVATYTTTELPSGADSLTAVYGGDSIYNTSTSAAVIVTVTSTTPAATTTTLTASSDSLPAGMTVKVTATISSPSATGTVTFYNLSTNLGTGTINAGVATLSTTTLPVGADSLTAVYPGDSNNAGSTSAAITVTIT